MMLLMSVSVKGGDVSYYDYVEFSSPKQGMVLVRRGKDIPSMSNGHRFLLSISTPISMRR